MASWRMFTVRRRSMSLNECTDAFIHTYFYKEYSYDVTVNMLSTLHGINMSMWTLKTEEGVYFALNCL